MGLTVVTERGNVTVKVEMGYFTVTVTVEEVESESEGSPA
jgi:hypothetical protein